MKISSHSLSLTEWLSDVIWMMVLVTAFHPVALLSQTTEPGVGGIAGVVLDAETERPLERALVVLVSGTETAVAAAGTQRFLRSGRTSETDTKGRYSFNNVPIGRYRLLVRRLGYRPGTLTIELGAHSRFNVSVGLEVAPILLEPKAVQETVNPYDSGRGVDLNGTLTRAELELERQDRFVSSDEQSITKRDVIQAVTLGETDLFRALQKFPGVSGRGDFAAEMWTRGAEWNQTRVYYDGLPMFNPLHTGGVFSGVNPDAVGAVFFHPGVRSVSIADGAAGVVEIESRRPGAVDFGGRSELSLVSAKAMVENSTHGGRGGWLLSGRRSYVDLLSSLVDGLRSDTVFQPYAFYDFAGRWEVPVGDVGSLQMSGLAEWDQVRGDLPGILRSNTGSWGNILGRVSLVVPVFGVYSEHFAGFSNFNGHISPVSGSAVSQTAPDAPTSIPTDNKIRYITIGSTFRLPTLNGHRFAFGYQYSRQSQFYRGPTPRTVPVDSTTLDSLRLKETNNGFSFWAEDRWIPFTNLSIEGGLRLESNGRIAGTSTVNAAPRIQVRYEMVQRRLAVSGGYGKVYQYIQSVAPAGPPIGPDLHLTDVWLLGSDSIPAIRSNIWTVGAEYWLSPAWLASVTLYTRSAAGVAVPDPRAGVLTFDRKLFVEAKADARGIELFLRRMAGRWTTSLAYALGSSNLRSAALTYPSPAHRRHVVDITTMYGLSQSLSVGGTFTYASPSPFTRVIQGTPGCVAQRTAPGSDTLVTACRTAGGPPLIGPAGEGRAPAYASLNLLLEWTRKSKGLGWSLTLQLRNVLNRSNSTVYRGSLAPCTSGSVERGGGGVCDRFHRGLPFLPLIGIGVSF